MKGFRILLLLLMSSIVAFGQSNYGITASSIQNGPSYLLNTYTGATVGLSLDKISSTATYAVQIKRASDNTTQDIGFDGDILDEAAVNTFCSGTTCVLTIWYDQSGNGNDFEIGGSTSYYTIYQSGSIVTLNGKPAIVLTNTATNSLGVTIDLSDIIGSSQAYHVTVSAADYDSFNDISFATDGFEYFMSNYSTIAVYFDFTDEFSSTSGITSNTQHINEFVYKDAVTAPAVYNDGVDVTNVSSTVTNAPTGSTVLSWSTFSLGFVQEYIVWPVDKSAVRAAIYSEISSRY